MEDQLATALIERLTPIFYFIGLFVVLGIVSFGGTLITLWWNSKDSKKNQDSDITKRLITIEIRLDEAIKDINNIGKLIRSKGSLP